MLGSLIAVNNPFPFSISGFTGLTTAQIISFFIVFVIFAPEGIWGLFTTRLTRDGATPRAKPKEG